jgi:hypothetical protein
MDHKLKLLTDIELQKSGFRFHVFVFVRKREVAFEWQSKQNVGYL